MQPFPFIKAYKIRNNFKNLTCLILELLAFCTEWFYFKKQNNPFVTKPTYKYMHIANNINTRKRLKWF